MVGAPARLSAWGARGSTPPQAVSVNRLSPFSEGIGVSDAASTDRGTVRTPEPLPPELSDCFAVIDAEDRGVSPGRLRRGDLRSPHPGVRARAEKAPATTLRERCQEYSPRLAPWQFFSHETALALHDVPLPQWPHRPALHVSAHRPAREPRTGGVVGHRLQLRPSAATLDRDGFAVEHPVRAWRQAGTMWHLDDLIAAADYLISGPVPLATVDDLRREVDVMGDLRAGILRRALAEVRAGVRSARETRLRLVIVRNGLPTPEVNWVLRGSSGSAVAELDLAFPRWRVAAEYDGRVHELDSVQFAKDGDRWDRIRAEGWQHVRIMNHHMRGSAAAAVAKVRDALSGAGWRPGL